MVRRVTVPLITLSLGVLLGGLLQPFNSSWTFAQQGCQTFSETGKAVCGRFLDYWQKNGGLAQQGFPISNPFTEVSELNGQPYTVQYFERAVFEYHPENQPPHDVLLSQLGTFQYRRKYPNGEPTAGSTPVSTQQPASSIVGQVFDTIGDSYAPLRFTVRSVQETTKLASWVSPSDRKFIILRVKMENRGTRHTYVLQDSMRLLDNQGRRLQLHGARIHGDGAGALFLEDPYKPVGPGLSVESFLAFEGPTDSTNYRLVPTQTSTP